MTLRLLDGGWEQEMLDGLRASQGSWHFACPFIKRSVVERLLATSSLDSLRVVTRFNLADFAAGVSDVGALRALVRAGAEVRGLRGLHAKVFVFGTQRALLTSANLTEAALWHNAEFGCVSDQAEFVEACRDYVDGLARRASAPVTVDKLDAWEATVLAYLATGAQPNDLLDLPDCGEPSDYAAAEIASYATQPGQVSGWFAESRNAFVKFFGSDANRESPAAAVLDEVNRSGCHWACTYPQNRRPRRVADGDTMFLSRLTHSPRDTLVFGRAIAQRHVDDRDTATAADIAQRPWKAKWPNYIRVHHAEFVAGPLANGIPLSELMDALGSDAFRSTQEHQRANDAQNTNPRQALRQQPAVELTAEAFTWLTERFEYALVTHGRVASDDLERLDWPQLPDGYSNDVSGPERLDQLKLRFWSGFADYLRRSDSSFAAHKAHPRKYYDLAIGTNRAVIRGTIDLDVTRVGQLGCELYLRGRQGGELVFDALYGDKDELESQLGQLSWVRMQKDRYIGIYREPIDFTNPQQWPELWTWLVDMASTFNDTFAHRVKRVDIASNE